MVGHQQNAWADRVFRAIGGQFDATSPRRSGVVLPVMNLRARFASRLWPWLTVWTVVGLGIRLATVYGRPNRPPGGDPYYYYWSARLLVDGHGFINPFNYNWVHHQTVQSASFAPGFTMVIAIPMLFGATSYFVTRIWCAIIGAAAVAVIGFTGREIAGRRVGLLAAFILAIYPNAWMSDEIGGAEALDPLLIALVLLLAYRFWKQPSLKRMIWLGAVLGFTMLARDELTLLVVFIVIPLALLARPLAWKRRFLLAGVGVLATATVIAPWVGYNMSRFEKTTFISTGLGVTLASADCNTTFTPPLEGYWSMRCALAIPRLKQGDESAQSANYESHVIKYLEHHKNRWVPVSLAKIGRAFGLYEPVQQINFDSMIETRPLHWAFIGLYSYYVLGILSLIGTVLLIRRRIPVFPMWAIGLNVVLACIIAFGNTRYRTPFEVCLVIMASVPIEWAWSRILPERRSRSKVEPTPPPADDMPAPEPALSGTS